MGKADTSRHAPQEIEAYLDTLPDTTRAALERVRSIVRESAPGCTERVSYGVPIFRLGADLVGMSAKGDRCSLHSMSPQLMKAMAAELKGFEVSGATLHFTPESPLPKALIERIVRERLAEVRP